jgi:hypothetical protein
LKLTVNKNMKWKTFWIQGFLIINSNILIINMGMKWTSTFGNQSNSMEKVHKFHQWYSKNLSLLFVKIVIKRGGDVTNANTMEYIHINVYP